MTDSAGHHGDTGLRGLVELRLEDLFGDRSPGRGATASVHSAAGDGAAADGAAWDGAVADGAVGSSSGWSKKHARDQADVDEPDPFELEPRKGGRARVQAHVDSRAERASKLSRLAELARIGRWRIDPQRRGAVAVMAAILVAGLAVGWQALATRPRAEPIADAAMSPSPAAGSPVAPVSRGGATVVAAAPPPPTAASTGAAAVTVDVVGRVHRPGLVTLSGGARVADAVRAAGGALAGTNLTSINLARVCVDGEQIAVGVVGAAPPAAPGTAGAAPGARTPGALVNLNTATADQLDALPGVGPVMAQRIIAYRTDHGPFTAVNQLQQVSGIGAAKYADLSPLVTV